jgi:uncharacterized protein
MSMDVAGRGATVGVAPPRLVATAGAADLLRSLRAVHGALMMHQSGGCCDGSSPMCYPLGEFIIGDRDILVGIIDLRLAVGEVPTTLPSEDVDAVPVWISGPQFQAWKHTQLVIDLVRGRGSGFSLEAPEGWRFLSRARAFSPEENAALDAKPPLLGAEYAEGARPPVPDAAQMVAAAVDACPIPGPPVGG